MKKTWGLLLILLTVMVVTSCTSDKPESDKVVFLTDSSEIYDDGFNQSIWEGVQDFARDYNVECTNYVPQDMDEDTIKEIVSEAVSNQADVIVMAGSDYGRHLGVLQKEFEDVTFIAMDVPEENITSGLADNTYVCSIKDEQAGYLAGYASVAEGYTKLGFFGGKDITEINRFGYGYIQGADDAAIKCNTDIEIMYAYAGDFFASADSDIRMMQWYDDGTQVVFACGGTIYTSVIKAALKSQGKMIGVDTDQHKVGEPYEYNPVITSAVKDYKTRVYEVLKMYHDDQFDRIGGSNQRLGLEDGDYVKLPQNEESWQFEQFTRDEYNEIVDSIVEGRINVSDSVENIPDVSEHTSIILP